MAKRRREPREPHHEDSWDRDWAREVVGPPPPRGRLDDEAAPYGYRGQEDLLFGRERARARYRRLGAADPTGPSLAEPDHRGEGRQPRPSRREALGFRGPSDEVSPRLGSDDWAREDGPRHYRGVGPRGYTRSDERILEDVCDALADDPALDASDIEVAVSSSEVTLSGTVDNRTDRRRAEDDTDWIPGVIHVHNNLRVRHR